MEVELEDVSITEKGQQPEAQDAENESFARPEEEDDEEKTNRRENIPRKVLWLTGDPHLFPLKAQKLLGLTELDASQTRKVWESLEQERKAALKRSRERVERISRMPPSKDQLALPHPNQRVSAKALKLLGDENLEHLSRTVVTASELNTARNHPKVFQLLGEPALVAKNEKVLRRLGSDMNVRQRRAQLKQLRVEAARQRESQQKRLQQALQALPTQEQLGLPPRAQNRRVSEKALRFFGEPLLDEMARNVVTPEMRKNVNAKTLRLLGDATLLSDKERQILGTLDMPASPKTTLANYKWLSSIASAWTTFRRAQ